jgi:hypothetical protein
MQVQVMAFFQLMVYICACCSGVLFYQVEDSVWTVSSNIKGCGESSSRRYSLKKNLVEHVSVAVKFHM